MHEHIKRGGVIPVYVPLSGGMGYIRMVSLKRNSDKRNYVSRLCKKIFC